MGGDALTDYCKLPLCCRPYKIVLGDPELGCRPDLHPPPTAFLPPYKKVFEDSPRPESCKCAPPPYQGFRRHSFLFELDLIYFSRALENYDVLKFGAAPRK